MTKNLKKGRRIGRTPKTGTERAISPRRVIVFKPSAILKQRINGHSPGGGLRIAADTLTLPDFSCQSPVSLQFWNPDHRETRIAA